MAVVVSQERWSLVGCPVCRQRVTRGGPLREHLCAHLATHPWRSAWRVLRSRPGQARVVARWLWAQARTRRACRRAGLRR